MTKEIIEKLQKGDGLTDNELVTITEINKL